MKLAKTKRNVRGIENYSSLVFQEKDIEAHCKNIKGIESTVCEILRSIYFEIQL